MTGMLKANSDGVIVRGEALDSGFTDADIKNAVRSGEIIIADRGHYIPTAGLPTVRWEREQEIYRRRCLTAAADGVVLTHQSAAAVLGLAMLQPDLRRIHVGVSRESSGKRRATRHVHCGLDMNDVATVDGVLATDLVRTAVDVALISDFAGALAAFDSALRLGATREELAAAIDGRRRRGSVRARQALRYAARGAANPGESWSRAQMIQAGLPHPVLQREIEVEGALYYSDFEWDRLLIGEFDGEGKYLNNRRPGESIAQAVIREKNRENALRDMGFDVVRWDWPVLVANAVADRVVPHLRRAGLL